MSFKPSFELRGTNRVRNQLRTLAAADPDITEPVIAKHAKSERRRLKSTPYPAKLPGQKYIRTGNLANRFRAERQKAGVWRVTNSASYAVWVIKRGMQNRQYHRGRWWTMEDVLEDGMPDLTRDLSRELEREMDRQ